MAHDFTPYQLLAKYYDEFQSPEDSQAQIETVTNYIRKHLASYSEPSRIKLADLGCGTGIFAIALADQGYQVQALDLSQEMLDIVDQKKAQLKPSSQANLTTHLADITLHTFPRKQDVLLALTDTLNHLNHLQLISFFLTAEDNLGPGGLFFFDLIKRDFLAEERGDHTLFVELDELISDLSPDTDLAQEPISIDSKDRDSNEASILPLPKVSMIWENSWLEEEEIAVSDLTFFELDPATGFYRRSIDQVVEYYHDFDLIMPVLEEGFDLIEVKDYPDRKLFVAKRK